MTKKITILKKAFLGLFISGTVTFNATAQQWDTVGVAGFSAGVSTFQNIEVYNDTLYTAYADGTQANKVTVKKYDGTSWVTVGTDGFSAGSGTELDLEINSAGELYVVYEDNANSNGITVMKYNGATWGIVGTANLANSQGQKPSLAFDANDVPYVAFLSGANIPNLEIVVNKFDGSNWVAVGGALVSINSTNYPNHANIAFDANNVPHVTYSASGTNIKRFDGTNWVSVGTSTVISAGEATYQDLLFDANGNANIAYRDHANGGKTTVLNYSSNTWSTVGTAGFTAGGSTYQKLGISSNGVLYVVQQDQNVTSHVSVYVYDGTSWTLLGGAPAASGSKNYTDMVINDDVVYVIFQDGLNASRAVVLNYNIGVAIDKIQALNNSVTIYPNPAYDQLVIEGIDAIEAINILTVDGKLVKSVASTNNTVAISEVPQGVYWLQIRTAKGIAHKRFVKK